MHDQSHSSLSHLLDLLDEARIAASIALVENRRRSHDNYLRNGWTDGPVKVIQRLPMSETTFAVGDLSVLHCQSREQSGLVVVIRLVDDRSIV